MADQREVGYSEGAVKLLGMWVKPSRLQKARESTPDDLGRLDLFEMWH